MMDKQRAKDILVAYSLCTHPCESFYGCPLCSFQGSECESIFFTEELLEEAMRTLDIKKVKLTDIKISKKYKNVVPNKDVVSSYKTKWCNRFCQEEYDIIVNQNNYLVDGYCLYIALKELNVEYAFVKKIKK